MTARPASARTAVPAAFVPARPEEITPDWLNGALDGAFPGVRVTTIRQTGFIDGTAQKLRFQLTYAPDGRQGPPSLWIKGGFDPKGAEQGDAFANEVRFFLDLADGCFSLGFAWLAMPLGQTPITMDFFDQQHFERSFGCAAIHHSAGRQQIIVHMFVVGKWSKLKFHGKSPFSRRSSYFIV